MNWTWSIRSADGGMNGLEFTKATTAGDLPRVLVHAAPRVMEVAVRAADDTLVARGTVTRDGDYLPMTLLDVSGSGPRRAEVWPGAEHEGLPVLLAGGEVGLLLTWENAADETWWRWTVEFSNHVGRPADWAPPGRPPAR